MYKSRSNWEKVASSPSTASRRSISMAVSPLLLPMQLRHPEYTLRARSIVARTYRAVANLWHILHISIPHHQSNASLAASPLIHTSYPNIARRLPISCGEKKSFLSAVLQLPTLYTYAYPCIYALSRTAVYDATLYLFNFTNPLARVLSFC